MKNAVLIIYRDFGPIYRLNLKAMTKAAREREHDVIVITLTDVDIGLHEADHVYKVATFDDFPEVSAIVGTISEEFAVKAVFPAFESDVALSFHVRELLHLEGPGKDFGELVRDKNLMLSEAAKLGVPVAKSYVPASLSDGERKAHGIAYPLIVKPSNGMASQNTFKINSEEELLGLAIPPAELMNFRVEEFIVGDQFHVDSIIKDGAVAFASVSRYSMPPLASLHQVDGFMGSRVLYDHTVPVVRALLAVNEKIITGFGFHHGVSHAEFFLTPDGCIVFGEIGARLPGAYIVNMIKAAFGIKMAREWVLCELDAGHSIETNVTKWVGGGLLKYHRAGMVHRLNIEDLENDPSVLFQKVWAREGDIISEAKMSCDACGLFVTQSDCEDDVFIDLNNRFRSFQESSVIG